MRRRRATPEKNEASRKEKELTAALHAEDARLAKDQDSSDKAARDAATSASSSDPTPHKHESSSPMALPGNAAVQPPDHPEAAEDMVEQSYEPMQTEQNHDPMQTEQRDVSGRVATDTIPVDVKNRDDHVLSPSSNATKKIKPTSDAQMAVDNRPRAHTHERPDSHMGIPSSRPSGCDVKRPRMDGEMSDLGSLRILSAAVRGVGGVDITEVYLPQRVVEACQKYQLVKGDSFHLRTVFDLSDPEVQQRVSMRIVETQAVLIILSPPCTK